MQRRTTNAYVGGSSLDLYLAQAKLRTEPRGQEAAFGSITNSALVQERRRTTLKLAIEPSLLPLITTKLMILAVHHCLYDLAPKAIEAYRKAQNKT